MPSIFLPPREVPLVLVGHGEPWEAALAVHLQSRGRAPVRSLAAGDLPGLTARGKSRAHLWQPPLWLKTHADLLPPPAAGPVLDLACGSGRAAVWLAERGYRVTGIDWQPEALALGRQLAAARGVSVDWRSGDLRDPACVPAGPWAAVMAFRYLQRDLLQRLPRLVQEGGVALLRTFREAPGYTGHPRPRHRLVGNELLTAFPAATCEILAYEKSHDPDGRPAAGIVARKLCSLV